MMKPVINQVPKSFVQPQDASSEKYYGVELFNSTEKKRSSGRGFVTQTSWRNGSFILLAPVELTGGNGWPSKCSKPNTTLKTYITSLVNDPQVNVFEFDDFLELMAWVSKGV